MFFEETLSNQVVALSPYSTTTMTRQYNADDSILAQENSAGYSAYVDASAISDSIEDGVLGFITVGVDTTSAKEVTSYNYYTGGDVFEAVTPSSTGTGTGTTTRSTGSTASASGSSSAAKGRFESLKWLTTLMALLV